MQFCSKKKIFHAAKVLCNKLTFQRDSWLYLNAKFNISFCSKFLMMAIFDDFACARHYSCCKQAPSHDLYARQLKGLKIKFCHEKKLIKTSNTITITNPNIAWQLTFPIFSSLFFNFSYFKSFGIFYCKITKKLNKKKHYSYKKNTRM